MKSRKPAILIKALVQKHINRFPASLKPEHDKNISILPADPWSQGPKYPIKAMMSILPVKNKRLSIHSVTDLIYPAQLNCRKLLIEWNTKMYDAKGLCHWLKTSSVAPA
jgi:hypothetical protein